MLEVSGLTTKYGAISALRDADLTVGQGEVIGLIGPNGAGKTTLLNTIAGLLSPVSGSVSFQGTDITNAAPEKLLRSGLALVPEHRRIFVDLTVEENLKIGGVTASSADRERLLEEMAELDEPSLGLAPVLVDLVFDLIDELRDQGRTLLIVEQNAQRMLEASDRAYVMRSGEVVASGTGSDLAEQDLFATFIR